MGGIEFKIDLSFAFVLFAESMDKQSQIDKDNLKEASN